MKKLPVLLLSLMTLPVSAQSILNTLNQHQSGLKPAENSNGQQSSNSTTKPDVKPSSETVSSSSVKCEETEQTSLPLAYITSLIQQKDGALNIDYSPSAGTLEVKAENLISNCYSMVEWKLKKPEIQGQKAYAVEAVIKRGDVCNVDGTCSYQVTLMEKGDLKDKINMNFKPTLKGFEECLQKTGVVKDGKVNPEAIATENIVEKFSGLNYSGKLLFLSHGPVSPLVKAKYGKFDYQNGCDYYEGTSAQPRMLLTENDARRERLDAEAAKLRECKVEEYGKLTKFIDMYQDYSSSLGDVRDRLIIEAAKKSAENIAKGKYTPDDMQVIKDFREYIVDPKAKLAGDLYEASLDAEGEEQQQILAQLEKVKAELAALTKAPYFTAQSVAKLVTDGNFDQAKELNTSLLILDNFKNIGGLNMNRQKVTRGTASQAVNVSVAAYDQYLVKEKERFLGRTGQTDPRVPGLQRELAAATAKIQENNQKFYPVIMEWYAQTQPGGRCYQYQVNTQNCIKIAQSWIQANIQNLQNANDAQKAEIARIEAEIKEWAPIDQAGRRAIAAQNGVELPAETPATATGPTSPGQVPTDNSQFFNFSQQPQVGQQPQQPGQQYYYQQNGMQPYQNYQMQQPNYGQNIYQQQQNPYAPYMGQQQQPWLGQQAYGYQPQYQTGMQYGAQYNLNFGVGGGAGFQQQNPYAQYGAQTAYQNPYGQYQQQPQGTAAYWYRPYQAYNQYSLYGR